MRSREEITREVESRNEFRAEVGLPLVSVPKEVEKIHKGELWQDFRDWCETYPLRAQVAEEVLQTIRKEIGDPTWVPRGVLSGGGGIRPSSPGEDAPNLESTGAFASHLRLVDPGKMETKQEEDEMHDGVLP